MHSPHIQPNEGLREALGEIQTILEKHSLAGFINITDGTHQDLLLHFEPSWGVIMQENEAQMRVTTEHLPNAQMKKSAIQTSLSTLKGMMNANHSTTYAMNQLYKAIASKCTIIED